MDLSKEQAVNTAIRCAKEYKSKLANTRILIIYRDRASNEIKSLEILFRPSNFQHLTGLLMVDDNGQERSGTAMEFYRRCLSIPFITKDEIIFKVDGTTPLKLGALPSLMDLTKITKICGNYNNTKKSLEADAIVGGVNFSLAISKYENSSHEFFPRSALMEDIRSLVDNPSQVLGILQKPVNDDGKYMQIKYVAKGITLKKVAFPPELEDVISIS
ncbi:MAG: hypothetical protein IJ075_05260 [Lachnospiraceae bacterium]|nr:hypothetical protein [Lachnospiraceae bacterium]MBQ9605946.1 hypothetical protein [Lachnospiraceae bacterium]